MGRRKIKIARITETRARNVTFQKRKAGVMKKAYELSALCGADVALIVMYEGKAAYFSSLDDVDALLAKFTVHRQSGRPMEVRTNDEFAALCARGHDTHDDGDESEEFHLPPYPPQV
ncbi:Myocyte-specific enhancer factor 2D [Allomyces arbusculus]|nr:Myocyte-specific enhancer factor 2D [Allomyces arbusculus]